MGSTWLTNGIGPVLLLSLFLSPVRQGNGATVNSCDELTLRAALAGGGTVTLACDGTITLASTLEVTRDTILDAQGHKVTISGGNAVRVFSVAPAVRFTLIGLTIANGRSTNGAAIYNDHGFVSLVSCVVSNNSVAGTDGKYTVTLISQEPFPWYRYEVTLPTSASGGAVFNAGTLSATASTFIENVAMGARGAEDLVFRPVQSGRPGSAGSDGLGGAILNEGSLSIGRCTFVNNRATGGPGGAGGPGAATPQGGSPGGAGGAGGGGLGGAVLSVGLLNVTDCTFIENRVTGGIGGSGERGTDSSLPGGAGGAGGSGGTGFGGAIFATNGSVWITNATLFRNSAIGGAGANGGGGGNNTSGTYAGGSGGNGGRGGDGRGGAIHIRVNGLLLNNTLSSNSVSGGAGGTGGAAGFGCIRCPATSGTAGSVGTSNGGAASGEGARILNTILNASTGAGNCGGAFVDGGHNICSDGSCVFANVGSLNNTDPMLGPLADNGGPTQTLPLLSGSPAIDAADLAASPPFDQRGVIRPLGIGSDIGAFERPPDAFLIRSLLSAGEQLEVRGFGIPNRAFRLLGSENLYDWNQVGAGTVSSIGTFSVDTTNRSARKFFRTVSP